MIRSRRKSGRYALGSAAVVSALGFAASWMCCLVPLAVFGSLGVTTAALGTRLEPYRPYLQAVSVLALAAAFLVTYLPRRGAGCGEDGICARRRRGRLALWIFAAAVLLLLTSPYWVGWITYSTL